MLKCCIIISNYQHSSVIGNGMSTASLHRLCCSYLFWRNNEQKMSLWDADMVCTKADVYCNLGGGQGGGVQGNCSGTERYFHQCFLWKRLLKKMLGERWEGGKEEREGERQKSQR